MTRQGGNLVPPRVPKLWKPVQEQNELALALSNAMQADIVGFDKDMLLFGI